MHPAALPCLNPTIRQLQTEFSIPDAIIMRVLEELLMMPPNLEFAELWDNINLYLGHGRAILLLTPQHAASYLDVIFGPTRPRAKYGLLYSLMTHLDATFPGRVFHSSEHFTEHWLLPLVQQWLFSGEDPAIADAHARSRRERMLFELANVELCTRSGLADTPWSVTVTADLLCCDAQGMRTASDPIIVTTTHVVFTQLGGALLADDPEVTCTSTAYHPDPARGGTWP